MEHPAVYPGSCSSCFSSLCGFTPGKFAEAHNYDSSRCSVRCCRLDFGLLAVPCLFATADGSRAGCGEMLRYALRGICLICSFWVCLSWFAHGIAIAVGSRVPPLLGWRSAQSTDTMTAAISGILLSATGLCAWWIMIRLEQDPSLLTHSWEAYRAAGAANPSTGPTLSSGSHSGNDCKRKAVSSPYESKEGVRRHENKIPERVRGAVGQMGAVDGARMTSLFPGDEGQIGEAGGHSQKRAGAAVGKESGGELQPRTNPMATLGWGGSNLNSGRRRAPGGEAGGNEGGEGSLHSRSEATSVTAQGQGRHRRGRVRRLASQRRRSIERSFGCAAYRPVYQRGAFGSDQGSEVASESYGSTAAAQASLQPPTVGVNDSPAPTPEGASSSPSTGPVPPVAPPPRPTTPPRPKTSPVTAPGRHGKQRAMSWMGGGQALIGRNSHGIAAGDTIHEDDEWEDESPPPSDGARPRSCWNDMPDVRDTAAACRGCVSLFRASARLEAICVLCTIVGLLIGLLAEAFKGISTVSEAAGDTAATAENTDRKQLPGTETEAYQFADTLVTIAGLSLSALVHAVTSAAVGRILHMHTESALGVSRVLLRAATEEDPVAARELVKGAVYEHQRLRLRVDAFNRELGLYVTLTMMLFVLTTAMFVLLAVVEFGQVEDPWMWHDYARGSFLLYSGVPTGIVVLGGARLTAALRTTAQAASALMSDVSNTGSDARNTGGGSGALSQTGLHQHDLESGTSPRPQTLTAPQAQKRSFSVPMPIRRSGRGGAFGPDKLTPMPGEPLTPAYVSQVQTYFTLWLGADQPGAKLVGNIVIEYRLLGRLGYIFVAAIFSAFQLRVRTLE